jgi:5-methylcytosine-specific restriction protein A
MPKGWDGWRDQVLARDPECRLKYPGCSGRSTEVDHIVRGGGDYLYNLQGVCSPCHKVKSQREARQARRGRQA